MATDKIEKINKVESASINLASGVSAARNRIRKVGNIVYLEFEITSSLSGGAYRNVGTLPTGYYRTDVPFVIAIPVMLNINGYLRVNIRGEVDIYPSANASSAYVSATYSLE